MRRFVLLLAALAAFSGCDNTIIYVDPDAGPPVDAFVPPFAEVLFAPCVSDEQCEVLGEGAFCRESSEGPAGGYCTRPCEDRTPCDAFGAHHHCIQYDGEPTAICVPACRNGADCPRAGYSCFGEIAPTGDGYCESVCRTDAECGDGTICDLDSGECRAPGPQTGSPYYATCSSDAECASGLCLEEVYDGGLTSWVLGACLSPCILEAGFNTTDFFRGDTLPNGGCPDNGVCMQPFVNQPPLRTTNAEGDLGVCHPGCDEDADCREGYSCHHTRGGHTFTNGWCEAADCRSIPCPGGRRCVGVTFGDGTTSGWCAPP